MDEKEILKKVEMLSDREKVLKDFYVKRGRLASNEEATKLIGPNIPTHPLSIWNNKSLHDRHNFHPDFSEEHFFPRETDVFFLKHECYSHIMKHCHDFYEICYVHRGGCVQTLFGDSSEKQLMLKEGDFLFIAPGQYHTILVDTDSSILNIGVRKSTFYQTFYNQLPYDTILGKFFYHQIKSREQSGYLLFQTGEEQPLWEDYRSFLKTYYNPNAYTRNLLNLKLSIMFINIVNHAFDYTASSNSMTGKESLVPAIITYVNENYQHSTVASVSEHFGYSPDYLNRMFKKATGKNLKQVITDIRMTVAKRMLSYDNLSIADISELLGYKDITSFTRNFKNTYHCFPSVYKKTLTENETG